MSTKNQLWTLPQKKHEPKRRAKDTKLDVEVRLSKTSILDIVYGAGILVRVRLRAKFDPSLIVESERHFPTGESTSRIRKYVEAMGGTLAEYLGWKYADSVDPSEVAWQATQVFDKLCSQLAQDSRLTSATLVY